jgi:hypothetical protein
VFTRVPAEADAAVVTLEALAVLFFYRGRAAEVEERDRGPFLAAAHPATMIITRTVARFALQLAVAERAARVRRHGVFRAKYRERRFVFVTRQAGVRAFPAVVRPLLAVSGADGQCGQQGSCDN